MIITVSVHLAEGDVFTLDPDEVAARAITALEGDPSKDICMVTVQQAAVVGSAGAASGPSWKEEPVA